MSKEAEKIRLEVKKKYDAKISELEKKCEVLVSLKEENNTLKSEKDALEEQLRVANEHIERLLEFCNMSKEELGAIKQQAIQKQSINKSFSAFCDVMERYITLV